MATMLRVLPLLSLLAALSGCELMGTMQLESAVRDALAKDPRTQSFTLEIAADSEGVVTITGEVDTPGDIDIVAEVAQGVEGVTRVNNRTAAPEAGSGMFQDTVVPGVGGFGL